MQLFENHNIRDGKNQAQWDTVPLIETHGKPPPLKTPPLKTFSTQHMYGKLLSIVSEKQTCCLSAFDTPAVLYKGNPKERRSL